MRYASPSVNIAAMNRLLPPVADVHVLVVGDVILDRYIRGRTDRVSPEAPVPVVQIEGSEDRLGGAANVALNVVSLGGRCTLVGAVGNDANGRIVADLLAEAGVEADLVVAEGWRTTLKERIVSRHKQLLRMDFEQPLGKAAADDVLARATPKMPGADALIIEDYDKGAVAEPARIIAEAQKANVAAIADPKFKPFGEYRGVDILKPNRVEFEQAVGHRPSEAELHEAGGDLVRKNGLGAIALTQGEEGLTLFEAKAPPLHVPAIGVDVYDSTGAGDTVAATLGICAALGWPLRDSVQVANLAGGVVCAKYGTAAVSVAELNQAMASRTHFDGDEHARRRSPPRRQLASAVAQARRRGERIVFTNGCFDILHAGHVGYLGEARRLGDRLIVAVNDDESARRLKGDGRPVNRLESRLRVLQGLAAVDWVVPFAEDTPEALLDELRPDVLVKGGDYALHEVVGAELVRGYGGDVRVLSLVRGCSTTDIVERIKLDTVLPDSVAAP